MEISLRLPIWQYQFLPSSSIIRRWILQSGQDGCTKINQSKTQVHPHLHGRLIRLGLSLHRRLHTLPSCRRRFNRDRSARPHSSASTPEAHRYLDAGNKASPYRRRPPVCNRCRPPRKSHHLVPGDLGRDHIRHDGTTFVAPHFIKILVSLHMNYQFC